MLGLKRGFALGLVLGLGATALLMKVWPGDDQVPQAKASPKSDQATESEEAPEPMPLRPRIVVTAGASEGARLLEELIGEDNAGRKVRLIEKVGISGHVDAVTHLSHLAETGQLKVKLAALEALGRIGDGVATDVLIGLTEAPKHSLRSGAIRALARAANEDGAQWLREVAESDLLGLGSEALLALGQMGDEGAEPYLAKMMKHSKVRIAASAAAALAELGTPVARQILFRAASGSGSGKVRLAAIEALSGFEGEASFRLLTRLLMSRSTKVVMAAMSSLARIGGDEAVAKLLAIATEGKQTLRNNAIGALREVGSPEARDALIEIFYNDDDKTRWAAARSLGNIGDEESVAALLAGLEGSKGLAQAAIAALAHVPTEEKVVNTLLEIVEQRSSSLLIYAAQTLATHLGKDAVGPLHRAAQGSRTQDAYALCAALGSIEGEESKNALLELARHGRLEIQLTALEQLVYQERIPIEESRDFAIERLADLRNSGHRYRLVGLLAGMDDPQATQALLGLVKEQSTRQLSSLVRSMSYKANASLMEGLVEMTRGEANKKRKLSMIDALAGSRSPQARAYLREVASGSNEEGNRALSSFAWQNPDDVVDIAAEAITSDDPTRRAAGLTVLAQVRSPEAIQSVSYALEDENATVRSQAVSALTTSNTPEAINVLAEAYREGHKEVRSAAAYQLAQSDHPDALKLIKSALETDEDSRYSSYWALTSLGTKEAMDILHSVADLDSDNGRWLRNQMISNGLIEPDPSVTEGQVIGLGGVAPTLTLHSLH